MKQEITYLGYTHIGKIRARNQDNFFCNGRIFEDYQMDNMFLSKEKANSPVILSVFDGMGGEEMGEMASLLAARQAGETDVSHLSEEALREYCFRANARICRFAEENGVHSMGTTAVLLAFDGEKAILCNIGDSKLFRFADDTLSQISKDHVVQGYFVKKPPLLQALGIPEDEMLIDPYTAVLEACEGDLFLLCTDGLTDMVEPEEIRSVLMANPLEKAGEILLEKALENGGRDNITVILCRVDKTTP